MATQPKSRLSEVTNASSAPAVIEPDEERAFVPQVRFKKTQTIDPGSFRPMRVYLTQAMSEKVNLGVANPGQWVCEGFAPQDEITFVPFATQLTRQYMPDPRSRPQCVAPEGDFGYGDPGGPCAECPLSQWRHDDATGRNFPPPCSEVIVVRGYSHEHRGMIDLSFKKGDLSKGRLIATQAVTRKYGNFAINLGVAKARNDRGQWYTPALTILDEVPEEARQAAADWQQVHEAMVNRESDPAPF